MLTREENELLTRVGPGTPMGAVMRRYWLPALLSNELPGPDCPPKRVKLLGEELVAFRDTQGRVGLLDEFCPHRLASLFLGRNEENGLRCVYHGWKFDVQGNCVDMPNEPLESRFKEKIHIQSYPTIEMAGVIWAYLGAPEKKPLPPGMEWTRAPESHLNVSKTWEMCNYLQAIEGGIDTVHSAFLHHNDLGDKSSLGRLNHRPQLEVERTDYGFRYAGIRDVGEVGTYIRIYQFVLPFHQYRPSQITKADGTRAQIPQNRGHMWVPVDDENTMVFNWIYATDEDIPFTPEYKLKYEDNAGRGPTGETMVRRRTRANDWLIDREVQRTKTFTGIEGLNTQDLAAQESMGPIVNREREHLGSTDKAIIALRRILLDAVINFQKGIDPPGVDPSSYRNVRAADMIVPTGTPWQEAGKDALRARR
jgi:phenylpropionate dioxygenase-like ring-hydroxylating dioxygenase large terminal subunit